MRGAARLRQKLEEFDNLFSTPCSPSGAADYSIAPRIPPDRPRALVHWFFGSLVSWLTCILADFSGNKILRKLTKWLFGGLVVVLRA